MGAAEEAVEENLRPSGARGGSGRGRRLNNADLILPVVLQSVAASSGPALARSKPPRSGEPGPESGERVRMMFTWKKNPETTGTTSWTWRRLKDSCQEGGPGPQGSGSNRSI